MLASEHLAVRLDPQHVTPIWLTSRDETWLRVLTDEVAAFDGQPLERMEAEIDERLQRRLRGQVPQRTLRGARAVLMSHYQSRVDAAVVPATLRRTLFLEAAARPRREHDEIVSSVAASLGIEASKLRGQLFADRPGARVLAAPVAAPKLQELTEQYNLSLLQALLVRCEGAVVEAREHTHAVVRFAKLKRLICTVKEGSSGPLIELSGPISLFHRTTRYGRAIASFLPALTATPAWKLEATCLIAGERRLLRVDASAPVARAHSLPHAHDSNVERALDRQLRKLGSSWTLAREAEPIQVGSRIFFPDFSLRRGSASVLIEVVGYYTQEYLAAKLEMLRALRDRHVIVLVDQTLCCDPNQIEAGAVLTYRGKPDAVAVLAAAERLVHTKG